MLVLVFVDFKRASNSRNNISGTQVNEDLKHLWKNMKNMKWNLVVPTRIHVNTVDFSGNLGRYGIGIGFGVSLPSLELTFTPSNTIIVTGAGSERARRFIGQIANKLGGKTGIELHIDQCIPPHIGLGSGTLLALACGVAWATCNKVTPQIKQIARITRRSFFSGVGLAIFEHGGFVLDQGYTKQTFTRKKPIECLVRFAVPSDWGIVLAIPQTNPSYSPIPHMANSHKDTSPVLLGETRELAQQVLVSLLPALANADYKEFCESLSRVGSLGYKRREVESYGGTVKYLIRQMVKAGADCAGMSSGGPTVYAIAKGQPKIRAIIETAEAYFRRRGGGQVLTASFDNMGARWSKQT